MSESIKIFNFSAEKIPLPFENAARGKNYVNWGTDNNYPLFLQQLYNDSAVHQAIIDGIAMYTIGNGLTIGNQKVEEFAKKVNGYGHTLTDVFKLVELDLQIFGGCAIQVILNSIGGLSELYWLDFSKIRVDKFESRVFFSKLWKSYGSEFKDYPEFMSNSSPDSTSFIYYYKGNKTRGLYPVPHYNGALTAIKTDIEIGNYHYNNVANGFAPNNMLSFNDGIPTQEDREKIEESIENKFQGTSGKKTVIAFSKGKENAPTVLKIESNNAGEQYLNLNKSVKESIYTAHKITSPALFGVNMDGSGFSKTEYAEAFEIFNKTVIKSNQDTLISVFNPIFKKYYGDPMIKINPFTIENPQENGNV